ncbi:MAG: hypothetical protein ACK4IK_04990 [Bacteroidia bacterium]
MKKILLALTFTIALVNFSNAQSIDDKIIEVYGDLNGSFFKGNKSLYESFENLLSKRIKIEEMPYRNDEKFIKISSLQILNKYNSNLKHEKFESIEKFNPLKYNMEFFSNSMKVYRIDDTNFILIINPQ